MPKYAISLLVLFLLIFSAYPQAYAQFTKETIQPGQVLVKLKPEFAYLNSSGEGMRSSSWEQLVPGLTLKKAVSFSAMAGGGKEEKRAAGKSGLDIRLYHQLSFDPARSVEDAIERLYNSGVVEIAEPVYLAKTYHTPNDPQLSRQYYIDLIRATEGWDITKGSNSVIIAILDSGIDLDHPDLAANIYKNAADPIDGRDNDGDGFVDNYWGWDFAGSDINNLAWDNDPNAEEENISHGTMVAGAASAVTNNNLGIAGVGYNARLMALKHAADNDDRNEGDAYLINLLQGVYYAAIKGADIINASYGGTSFSQIEQDIYKMAALDYDVLIVAAAGNESNAEPHYPSDYDYVISVGATTQNDTRASFSNYGYKVDISAPGSGIYTTDVGGNYTTVNGTSFAAPLVAGAAALVKTLYPDFNGAQLGEVLRITADPSFTENLSVTYQDKMGRGRLDVYAALTETKPSIRMDNSTIEGPGGDVAKPGKDAVIYGDFFNFLWPATNATVTISTSSAYITVLEGEVSLGDMQMMERYSNQTAPFVIHVNEGAPSNAEVVLRLDYTADNYTDYQYISVLVNPSFYNLRNSLIATTVAGNGRIGYQDTNQQNGIGFTYGGRSMLYELGVMIGTSGSKVVNNVRSTNNNYDNDFQRVHDIAKDQPGTVADVDVFGTFSDEASTITTRLGIEVDYLGMIWNDAPNQNMVIMEYEVVNTSTTPLEDFYFGLYADWDINNVSNSEGLDRADWDAATQTGYVYAADEENRLVGGIQVLTGTPNYWAIDNDPDINNNPFGVYDGFTDPEKFRSISSGIGREQAGLEAGGNDVSHTVASGPYTVAAGDSLRIAFALHAAPSIEGVLASARQAIIQYESLAEVPRPEPETGTDAPPTGLDKEEIANLQLYPNPTSGELTIALPMAQKGATSIRVLDVTGRQLLHRSFPGAQTTIRIDMPSENGMYLLQIEQQFARSVRRIVVQQ